MVLELRNYVTLHYVMYVMLYLFNFCPTFLSLWVSRQLTSGSGPYKREASLENGSGRLLFDGLACGVPRGSVLSPMLFNLHTSSSGVSVPPYTDYTQLFFPYFLSIYIQGSYSSSEPVSDVDNGLNEGKILKLNPDIIDIFLVC